MLPPGKKPIVLSIDDLSYYHSYKAAGFPDKLVLDENGMEDANASRRVEIKFRLKDEEMIQELSQLLSNEAEVVAEANP